MGQAMVWGMEEVTRALLLAAVASVGACQWVVCVYCIAQCGLTLSIGGGSRMASGFGGTRRR